ncbi:hypothetical protein H6P81_015935 [Aristolochia fimbriata]|uniref:Uncharacterized protein n=1 Tax=Aristolochia fimbriata TaxID=158543 RepID=A0AAV7E905_ARIFI|nr:hypothetical protein H6P81_015935 [Aristolochia fimbriata]
MLVVLRCTGYKVKFDLRRFMTRSDPEPERNLRQNLKENQSHNFPKDQEDMENLEITGIDGEQAPIPKRTMVDYVTPSPNTNRTSIITPTIQANNFDIRPQIIAMLQYHYQFSGLAHEDPNEHLKRFFDLCATFKCNGVSDDAIRLRLFKFTLVRRAKTWLNTLQVDSIVTWEYMQKKFLDIEVDKNLPIILGRPFLATAGALIDVKQGKLTLRLNNDKLSFNIKEAIRQPATPYEDFCFSIDMVDSCIAEVEEEVRT